MRPLISILIPAYNAQAWISDTLRSALAQTWEPKEIIVVDDGSTDRTLAIARRFESSQLRVVTQKNQGAAAARNTALSLSKGIIGMLSIINGTICVRTCSSKYWCTNFC